MTDKPKWLIDGIPSEQAEKVWPAVWPLIRRAVDYAPEEIRMKKDELFDLWQSGQMQVWVVVNIEKQELVAAVMTSIIDADKWFPESRALEVPFVGGKGMKHWIGALYRLLNSYAKASNLQYMVGYGRKGWEKVVEFKHIGYTSGGIRVMVRAIERVN